VIPDWWRDAVLDARAYSPDNIWFPDPSKLEYEKTGLDRRRAPRGTALKEVGKDKIAITIGTETVVVPKGEFGHLWTTNSPERISGCFDGDRCYLALHDVVGMSCDLICLDKTTGKTRWTYSGHAAGFTIFLGVGDHFVTVRHDKGRVVVFGMGTNSIYVEGVDAVSGKPEFRFGTWDYPRR
jgi:hypothetical protein